MMAKSKRPRKQYTKKPIKDTLYLFSGRNRISSTDQTRLKLIYREIFESVRVGKGTEKDLFALMAMLEDVHIAVEYCQDLDDKETTFSQLRETYRHLKHAIDNKRSSLTGEGFAMLRDALEIHEGLIDNSTEYVIKQIVGVCSYRAHKGEWRVAA